MTLSNIRPSILSLSPSDSLALTMAARKMEVKPKPTRLPSTKALKPKKPKGFDVKALSAAQLEQLINELEQTT